MSHSVVRGAIFIPLPLPGGGLSYYILLTRQFGIYLEYDSRVTPNTPHLSLEENKRLYLEYDSLARIRQFGSNTTVWYILLTRQACYP